MRGIGPSGPTMPISSAMALAASACSLTSTTRPLGGEGLGPVVMGPCELRSGARPLAELDTGREVPLGDLGLPAAHHAQASPRSLGCDTMLDQLKVPAWGSSWW